MGVGSQPLLCSLPPPPPAAFDEELVCVFEIEFVTALFELFESVALGFL